MTGIDILLRIEVLTAVRMAMFFWIVTPCELVSIVSEKHIVSIFSPEDGET
jgi:hypothetical protein